MQFIGHPFRLRLEFAMDVENAETLREETIPGRGGVDICASGRGSR